MIKLLEKKIWNSNLEFDSACVWNSWENCMELKSLFESHRELLRGLKLEFPKNKFESWWISEFNYNILTVTSDMI